jgi:hypothetical protein
MWDERISILQLFPCSLVTRWSNLKYRSIILDKDSCLYISQSKIIVQHLRYSNCDSNPDLMEQNIEVGKSGSPRLICHPYVLILSNYCIYLVIAISIAVNLWKYKNDSDRFRDSSSFSKSCRPTASRDSFIRSVKINWKRWQKIEYWFFSMEPRRLNHIRRRKAAEQQDNFWRYMVKNMA